MQGKNAGQRCLPTKGIQRWQCHDNTVNSTETVNKVHMDAIMMDAINMIAEAEESFNIVLVGRMLYGIL